jgi:ribosome-binding protein aMBF1 (putative translation factor)
MASLGRVPLVSPKTIVKATLQTSGDGMQLDVEVGQRIKVAREVVLLGVNDLARIISIEPSMLRAIEEGKRRPSPSLLFQIAEALGASVSYFFSGSDAD